MLIEHSFLYPFLLSLGAGIPWPYAAPCHQLEAALVLCVCSSTLNPVQLDACMRDDLGHSRNPPSNLLYGWWTGC